MILCHFRLTKTLDEALFPGYLCRRDVAVVHRHCLCITKQALLVFWNCLNVVV